MLKWWFFHTKFLKNRKKGFELSFETSIFLFIEKINLAVLNCKLEKTFSHRVICVWSENYETLFCVYIFFCVYVDECDCDESTHIHVSTTCETLNEYFRVVKKLLTIWDNYSKVSHKGIWGFGIGMRFWIWNA